MYVFGSNKSNWLYSDWQHVFRTFDGKFCHALGAMVVGVCCGSTSYVYKIESLSLRKQIAFHFTIGLGGYLLIAYKLGWMPISNIGYVITFILMAIIIFTSIWTGFYFYNRNEAKKYNAKIKEIEKENDN